MKKIILLIFTLVVIYTVGLISFFEYKEKNKEITIGKDKINGMISVMVEKNGKYERSTSSSWPNGDYELNKNLSKCENGSELKYDKKTKKVTMSTNKTDKCYLYFDITGTEANPYKIETIEDLVNLSNDVNGGNSYAGKYIVLTRDLDFKDSDSYENSERTDYEDYNEDNNKESLLTELTTGSGFKPIGNIKIAFEGNFNGKEHRINNLYINISDYSKNYVGFIGHIKNATISNLTIQGSIHSEIENNLGGIAGYVTNGNIENCVNEVNVTSDSDDWGTGGLIGPFTGDVEITNCINKANVKGGLISGGIACNGDGDNNIIITKSANYGNIENTSERVGGILGNVTSEAKIIESFNNGKIKGTSYTGGLVGYTSGNLEINDSYNTGKVYREGESANFCGVGGILGESSTTASVSIKKSYNSGDVIDNPKIAREVRLGGIVGFVYSPLLIENSYNTGIIKKENTINYNNYDIDVGGLVGIMSDSNITKITNSYNLGMLENGNRIGGIVGYNYRCNELIITNSYNNGYIKTNIIGKERDLLIGGLVGYNVGDNTTDNNKTIILNSYNLGNINNQQINNGDNGTLGRIFSSGIIGLANGGGNIKIINAYNIGNIVSITTNTNVANGITYIYGTSPSILNLNNVYNLGTMQATTNYEIGFIKENNTTKTINNAYYNSEKTVSNLTDENLIGMTETDMKNESFVAILNNNIENITLTDIDASLKDYTLSKWKLGEYGYPVFENE